MQHGGYWDIGAAGCRSAGRSGSNPDKRHDESGFRLVKTAI